MAVREHANENGQMTVELCIIFPVAIIIAAIAVNALLFFSDCASFDRAARNTIRALASSPSTQEDASAIAARIENELKETLDAQDIVCTISHADGGLNRFTATRTFKPTLFGMGLRDQIWGIPLPRLTHATELTVDTFSPQGQVSTNG